MEAQSMLFMAKDLLVLDPDYYGMWKVLMMHRIKGIHEDAWTAVELGWESPKQTAVDSDGNQVVVLKPNTEWSKSDKALSRLNSLALSAIFGGVRRDQFSLIQGCTSAKEAWEILQTIFEGTTSVKRTRLDILASEFENLRMYEFENITAFSGRIYAIANEARALGKNYKNRKLVKKLWRGLAHRYHPVKIAMDVALDIDNMSFQEVTSRLLNYELQYLSSDVGKNTQGIDVFSVCDSEENTMASKTGELKSFVVHKRRKSLKIIGEQKRNKVQCHGCQGCGHFKSDCPSVRKKGFKSLHSPKRNKNTQKPQTNKSKFVALCCSTKLAADKLELKSDNGTICYTDQDSKPAEEELKLLLNDQINILRKYLIQREKENQRLVTEKNDLLSKISNLEEDLVLEKVKSCDLEKRLKDQLRSIKMLSSGTKDLDKILTTGITCNVIWGLGYHGSDSGATTQFVKG
ncbi:PREDICTED: uncharacterized protein LOC104738177 [Camelina sativa]|uniref:Uncharacterized protein LOC104738177 n=1 Tax=Camelina sativa TaxID=90675 RepID=A0ABM0VIH2_CAMSA|nr:PREDICTED: uncharacterized protein LOC104738177 [Camelina sativa]